MSADLGRTIGGMIAEWRAGIANRLEGERFLAEQRAAELARRKQARVLADMVTAEGKRDV